ncbi:MAG: copper-binding protein [Betaproteobacteria bacterium]|nr:copper-binding protein [Betaproteobacteria bacterium]
MKGFLLVTLLAAAGTGTAFAHHEAGGRTSGPVQAPAASLKSGKGTGMIQQIDREKGTVTIKHGPLQGINVSAATMSYRVRDKAILANLWSPQRVEFELTYDGKQYLVTRIK